MAQNVDILKGQLPLKGVLLCCTALPQDVRTNLADVAIQMGAVHKLDLTSDVTHLIVGSTATPKYKYVAKERPDVKVLHPDWIDAIRQSWMEGGDVDVEALEQKHHFPPFSGLHICVTGFDSHLQRNSICQAAEEHGATYNGDLTKSVTHLIAAAPKGEKYTHAKRWGMAVVTLKWFEDSLRRGMALDESYYDPNIPDEDQGRGAFKRQRTSLGKHGRSGDAQSAAPVDTESRKKLRRTASTRLEGQSQDMWLGMSAEPGSAEPVEADRWRDDEDKSATHVSESSARPNVKPEPDTITDASKAPMGLSGATGLLFTGCHVLINGFDERKVSMLGKVLLQNGATIVQTTPDLEDASRQSLFRERYLIAPHDASRSSCNVPGLPAGTIITTEWWVERCLHSKDLLNPEHDPLSCPLGDAEIQAFAHLSVSTTGFSGVDLRQIAESVNLMGASYQEKVTSTTSVLVSGSTTIKKEKAYYASKHGIPVVSIDWLWACLKAKQAVAFKGFQVKLPLFDAKDFTTDGSMGSPTASGARERAADNAVKRKDDSQSKRLSSSRKRHATPSLDLLATKANVQNASSKPRPIIHEDEDDEDEVPQKVDQPHPTAAPVVTHRGSQPLQPIPPNSSPRKTSHELSATEDDTGVQSHDTTKQSPRKVSPSRTSHAPASPQAEVKTHPKDPPAPARTHHELASDFADLLQKTSSSAVAGEAPQRRKARPLGRALSGTSSRSLSNTTLGGQGERHSDSCIPEGDETGREASRGMAEILAPPSTQLGYETLEAENHRLQMSKKMGTVFQDDADGRRVPHVGVVRDTMLYTGSGVGNRVKVRRGVK